MATTGHDAARASTASPTIARRTLLSAAAALPVARVPAPAAPHPDAALLDLGHDLEAAWANENRLAEDDSVDGADVDAAACVTQGIAERIVTAQARTLDGLIVKARAVLWCAYEADEVGPEMLGETTDLHLAGSIIQDLLRMAGEVRS